VKPGDLILQFNGTEVRRMRDLPLTVARAPIGEPVKMIVLRDGKETTLDVTLDRMKDEEGSDDEQSDGTSQTGTGKLGIQVRPTQDEDGGVQIVQVQPGSPADRAQLQEGDVIRSVNQKRVHSVSDFQKSLSRSTGSLLLLVERNGGASFVVVPMGK